MEAVLGADAFYDAGDQGCSGPGFVDIIRLLEALTPGSALEIRSETHAGRAGLQAFCRLKGFPIEAEDAGPDADRILIRKP